MSLIILCNKHAKDTKECLPCVLESQLAVAKAEIQSFHRFYDLIDKAVKFMESENKRLREELEHFKKEPTIKVWEEDRVAFQKEIKRLREALVRITHAVGSILPSLGYMRKIKKLGKWLSDDQVNNLDGANSHSHLVFKEIAQSALDGGKPSLVKCEHDLVKKDCCMCYQN